MVQSGMGIDRRTLSFKTGFGQDPPFGEYVRRFYVHLWYVFDLFYNLENFLPDVQLLPDWMCASDALITKTESYCSKA